MKNAFHCESFRRRTWQSHGIASAREAVSKFPMKSVTLNARLKDNLSAEGLVKQYRPAPLWDGEQVGNPPGLAGGFPPANPY